MTQSDTADTAKSKRSEAAVVSSAAQDKDEEPPPEPPPEPYQIFVKHEDAAAAEDETTLLPSPLPPRTQTTPTATTEPVTHRAVPPAPVDFEPQATIATAHADLDPQRRDDKMTSRSVIIETDQLKV